MGKRVGHVYNAVGWPRCRRVFGGVCVSDGHNCGGAFEHRIRSCTTHRTQHGEAIHMRDLDSDMSQLEIDPPSREITATNLRIHLG